MPLDVEGHNGDELRQEGVQARLTKDNEILCSQTIFVRSQTDGASRLFWSVMDLGDLTKSSGLIYSPVFALRDGTLWKLILQPK